MREEMITGGAVPADWVAKRMPGNLWRHYGVFDTSLLHDDATIIFLCCPSCFFPFYGYSLDVSAQI
jgi:hypothetical protein